MLKLNDTALETVSGGWGFGTTYLNSFNKNLTISKNTSIVNIDKNLILGSEVLISVQQQN